MEGKHKNDEQILPLMEKYGLEEDVDVFTKKDRNGRLIYRIINRRGIDKIAAQVADRLIISWDILFNSTSSNVFLKFAGTYTDDNGVPRTVITSGEASEDNVQQEPKYLLAMAEARGRSRVILKLLGFYELGVYSEDEADEFRDFVHKGSAVSAAPARKVSAEEIPDFLRG